MTDESKPDPRAVLALYGWQPETTDGNAPKMWMNDAVVWVADGTFNTHGEYEFSPAELRAFAQLAEESGS
jgi:hypothetical protein